MQNQPPRITELARARNGSPSLFRYDYEDGAVVLKLSFWDPQQEMPSAVQEAAKALADAVRAA